MSLIVNFKCQSTIEYGQKEIQVKRDDLFPVIGSGNKGRKLARIFQKSLPAECGAIISNGGTQSNHARVCAIMAAEKGLEAHLVLHGSRRELEEPEGNLLISLLAGAKVYVTQASDLKSTIESIFDQLTARGKLPFVIPGGAHCLEGALAYADAVDEICVMPDVIILPSGTGATQAGILAGLDRKKAGTKVIGVSVARRNPRGSDVVLKSYREARAYLGLKDLPEREVIFDDRWTYGGYAKTDDLLLKTICDVARKTGLILDPIYTGKAFTGMLEMIEAGEIDRDESLLFWHTGGLINALASAELKKIMAKS